MKAFARVDQRISVEQLINNWLNCVINRQIRGYRNQFEEQLWYSTDDYVRPDDLTQAIHQVALRAYGMK